MLTLLLLVIFAALVFEFINGFHDTANSIATVVATKVLSPGKAVMLAAFMNLLGAFFGTAVAKTISSGLIDAEVVQVTSQVILCALMGGITVATVLTLFFLPALYATWFRVKSSERDPAGGAAPPALHSGVR